MVQWNRNSEGWLCSYSVGIEAWIWVWVCIIRVGAPSLVSCRFAACWSRQWPSCSVCCASLLYVIVSNWLKVEWAPTKCCRKRRRFGVGRIWGYPRWLWAAEGKQTMTQASNLQPLFWQWDQEHSIWHSSSGDSVRWTPGTRLMVDDKGIWNDQSLCTGRAREHVAVELLWEPHVTAYKKL